MAYTGDAELIPSDDGAPLKVRVHLTEWKEGLFDAWGGDVYPHGDERIEAGETYTLRLPNRKEGTLLIDCVSLSPGIHTYKGQGLGSGPSPF